MKNGFAVVVLGVVMFALGAYSNLGAQQERLHGTLNPEMHLPHIPRAGDTIQLPEGAECKVVDVEREWVRCAAPQNADAEYATRYARWHNIYNGHTHTVVAAKR